MERDQTARLIVLASMTGKMDLSKFDPWDPRWWRRLEMTKRELQREQDREAAISAHLHWITLASKPNLTPEAYDNAITQANTMLREILIATYPQLKDKLGEVGIAADRASLVKAHEERYGRPGEPRYEEMIVALRKELRKKLTPREKQRERAIKRLRWQRERQAAT